MTQYSRCGLPLPLSPTFDCDQHMNLPANVTAPDNMSLKEQNSLNVAAEKHNERSVTLTRAYQKTRGTPAGEKLDVGAPLEALYEYKEDDIELLASSKELVDATGPLPTYLVFELAKRHKKNADEEKRKKEQDRAKPDNSASGALVMRNPIHYSSVTADTFDIPTVFVETVKQQMWLPLHWWRDEILRKAQRDLGSAPWTSHTPKQTTPGVKAVKVDVLDFEAMAALHGDLSRTPSLLTPSIWKQCVKNLLRAMEEVSVDDPTAVTPATELCRENPSLLITD
ncbi:hypothetical protein R3P38DRAFT_3222498 [Favolaschia claudopus]|uniref:Uncharacterized protein n=1 Tax=Favolaschia claudopus TaxID=2862362 RepID=A0AAV9ZYN3_9AGAR